MLSTSVAPKSYKISSLTSEIQARQRENTTKIPTAKKLGQRAKTKAYLALSKFSKNVLYSEKPTKQFSCLSGKTATSCLCVLAGQSCDWLLFGFHPEVRAVLKLWWLFNDESCVYRSPSLPCCSLLLLFPSESYLRCIFQPQEEVLMQTATKTWCM